MKSKESASLSAKKNNGKSSRSSDIDASKRLGREGLEGSRLNLLLLSGVETRPPTTRPTIDGAVVGRELDPLYSYTERRGKNYGSVVVVIATDAPLIPAQLNRLSKRAALGLGRVGSFAATTSGEIIFAFSTGNRVPRIAKEQSSTLNLTFVNDEHMNLLYEAVIEATEEAALNAMFCSGGMTGVRDRFAPPLPAETVQEFLMNRQASAEGIRGESEQ